MKDTLGTVEVCDSIWFVRLPPRAHASWDVPFPGQRFGAELPKEQPPDIPQSNTGLEIAADNLREIITNRLRDNKPVIFARRGDGEKMAMDGTGWINCDGVRLSDELGAALRESFSVLEKNCDAIVIDFDDQARFNSLLHRHPNNPEALRAFYNTIRELDRHKIFVGPKRLSGAAELLMAEHVVVPLAEAFLHLPEILGSISKVLKPNSLILFCCGPTTEVIMGILASNHPGLSMLDLGSAFDPVFLDTPTRTEQFSHEECQKLYADWLAPLEPPAEEVPVPAPPMSSRIVTPETFIDFPQETHPERLWAEKHLKPDTLVLDVGCGSHKTVPWAIGVDPVVKTDILASAEALPQEDGTVDTIISRHSFEHCLDPILVLQEWDRVLKPGGKIIMVLPDHSEIDTMQPIISHGTHLHAYTQDSFLRLVKAVSPFGVNELRPVILRWSFGAVLRKAPVQRPVDEEPLVSICIPTLGRPEQLNACISSAQDQRGCVNREIVVEHDTFGPDRRGVAKNLKAAIERAKGEYILFVGNDCQMEPDCLSEAMDVMFSRFPDGIGLVALNDQGPFAGKLASHFVIARKMIPMVGGEVFPTCYRHVAGDNELTARAKKLGRFAYAEKAKIIHRHFTQGAVIDEVYKLGWKTEDVLHDRELLKKRAKEFEFEEFLP